MSGLLQHPKIPKYYKLAEELRQQIQSGALLPGARLPSISETQAMHGISQGTVKQAHALLERDGLIVREHGRGIFVAHQNPVCTTKTLGLILHTQWPTSFYMRDLLAGVHEEATQQGLELRWLNDQDVNRSNAVDAILMFCDPSEALALNLPPQVPHVLLFQHSADFTCIAADDFNGGKMATQHLLELGHRRIACLSSSDYDSISRQRVAGYQAALQEAGVPVDEGLIKVLLDPNVEGYRQSGERTMAAWLEEGWRDLGCTAILSHNDHAAIGVIRTLNGAGLQVPGDVSVFGFDGTELSELSTPPLTTIKIPLREIGATAVKMLAAQIEAGVPLTAQKVVLPVQLKTGASTALAKPDRDNKTREVSAMSHSPRSRSN
jgi:DNA-binding LacI/PurR family transcriptional regulator